MNLHHKRILVVGASSDLAGPLNRRLCLQGTNILGLHYNSNPDALTTFIEGPALKRFHANLKSAKNCKELVSEFCEWAGGIDALIQLSGTIEKVVHWQELDEAAWNSDLNSNLTIPFFLAQESIGKMNTSGGRIILTSTASAAHGGGSTSLAYGVAKAGVECMVKGLARDAAKKNILVNAIAPGFFATKFHTVKMGRSPEQLTERAKMIPMQRSGDPEELAGVIEFLLSDAASFITGQVITVSGGDWL